MARHYSTRDSVRQMLHAMLARYFAARGVFGKFDFVAKSQIRHEALSAAQLALPEAQRTAMDATLRDIFENDLEKKSPRRIEVTHRALHLH